MAYKKSELTQFAKECARVSDHMFDGICLAEDMTCGDIAQKLIRTNNDELLYEVSKRFAKYAKNRYSFQIETGDVQNFQEMIEKIVDCCDENNWFE